MLKVRHSDRDSLNESNLQYSTASWQKLLNSLNLVPALLKKIENDNVSNGAAALAHFFLLSIFPGLIFLLTLLPFLHISHMEQAIMDLLRQALPGDAANLFVNTVTEVTSQKNGGLLSFGALFSVWASSSGMHAIITQMNVTYGIKESRPYWKARIVAIALTSCFGVLIILAFGSIVLGSGAQIWLTDSLGWDGGLLVAFAIFRWIVILSSLILAFSLIDHFAPAKKRHYQFLSMGSCLASVLFIMTSIGFKLYVENFGRYDAMYGGIGAIIVLMLWLYITGWLILLGAEVNSLIASQSVQPKLNRA